MTAASDVRAALEARLPRERLERLHQVQHAAASAGLHTYLVGGFVRDLLLGRTPGDFDFVVEPAPGSRVNASAPHLARSLASQFGGQVTVHTPFGTATWIDPAGNAVDFASTRTESYPQPAVLPLVRPAASIRDDLTRRDFTINALAVRIDGEHYGELLDPFDGQADLAAGVVRVLHADSFRDDPTRMFRAVRYELRLGFRLAPETAALIPPARQYVDALSGERVRYELELIVREPQVVPMLARLQELGLLSSAHPALEWTPSDWQRAEVIPQLPRPDWQMGSLLNLNSLYLALLLDRATLPGAEDALRRLAVTREVHEAVLAALQLRLTGREPSEVVAQLERVSEAALVTAYVLQPEARERLDAYLAHWRFVRAQVTGDDLVAMGLRPGPQFKSILWRLRAARLNGEVSDRAGELALVRQMVNRE